MTETANASAPATSVDAEADGYSDRLIADVSLDGAPAVLAYHQMDRRRRAELTRRVATITPRLERVEALIQPGKARSLADLAAAADVVEFMADVEDLVASVAVDQAEFRTWAGNVDDLALLALFASFVRTFSAGEAPSSSS